MTELEAAAAGRLLMTATPPSENFHLPNCREPNCLKPNCREPNCRKGLALNVSRWLPYSEVSGFSSMVTDAVTRKELTVYMIGVAIASATAISAVLYWLNSRKLDFVVILATLWMVSGIVLEIITPEPLPFSVAVVAVAPLLIVGIVINLQYWRRASVRPTSTPQQR
jgi:hypothetical protein